MFVAPNENGGLKAAGLVVRLRCSRMLAID
jgi:hypothetical protein